MLILHNSMTGKQEPFRPRRAGRVIVYTCGPSIYQLPHIGNYRTFLYEDILVRYLEYLGYRVKRALFVTEVEDKSIAEAEKKGVPLQRLTGENLARFRQELRALGARTPGRVVRSSQIMGEAARIIERLVRWGHAYWHGGNIYYDPRTFRGFGRLYGLDMRGWPRQRRRFHRDTYPGAVWNRGDFILWHGERPGDRYRWETSLGKGRPSWNVQDPAMALKTYGLQADIYCGGVDNLVRHHDYVIAVAEAYSGKRLANIWLHGEHLLVDGKKMSKSRGNIVYLRDLVDRVCQSQHLRFFLVYSHYRRRLNFTWGKFQKACERLRAFKEKVGVIQKCRDAPAGRRPDPGAGRLVERLRPDFESHMNDDLQVKKAFDSLFINVSRLGELAAARRLAPEEARGAIRELKKIDTVLNAIF
jgi:cysteinyl-tRNA synthetase